MDKVKDTAPNAHTRPRNQLAILGVPWGYPCKGVPCFARDPRRGIVVKKNKVKQYRNSHQMYIQTSTSVKQHLFLIRVAR